MAAADQTETLSVSRETRERLEIYLALLEKWNSKINLVAPSTLGSAWRRHFLDSAQVFDLAPQEWSHWVDLGSGGGFPGMVIAILAAERTPERKVTLLESDMRKATFLRTVGREVEVTANVLAERIEVAEPQNADVVSARALAPLPRLLRYVDRHCRPGGTALLLKGAQAHSEVLEAQKTWHFELRESPSVTDSQAVILEVRELRGV